jgi:hypothetical protein
MAVKTKLYTRASLHLLLVLAMVLSLGIALSAQSSAPTPMPPSPPTANPPGPPTATPPSPPTATPPSPTPVGPTPIGPAPRWPNPPGDITQQDVSDMAHFLNSHPEIFEQLRRDPSLIDNQKWVSAHPALQQYLHEHQRIAAAFRSDPNLFMSDEDREDHGLNISRRDVADMSHFLNNHPEIAEQLRKDPSLIDNRRWVADHPALQEYLREHQQIADAFRADPGLFMRDEELYDHSMGEHDRVSALDRDERYHGELTSFGQFLGGHSSLAAELSTDPTLANNKEYLATHPELDEYLRAHPAMSQQLAADPQAVMSSNVVLQNGGFNPKPVGPTPRPNPSPEK